MYANQVDYTKWLRGRAPRIPLTEFDYWAYLASQRIDQATFDRLHDEDARYEFKPIVAELTCEIAEILFQEDEAGDRVLSSMSIDGYSEGYTASYRAKPQDRVNSAIRRVLGNTGLLYRGV